MRALIDRPGRASLGVGLVHASPRRVPPDFRAGLVLWVSFQFT
jgi:hypothetical protein